MIKECKYCKYGIVEKDTCNYCGCPQNDNIGYISVLSFLCGIIGAVGLSFLHKLYLQIFLFTLLFIAIIAQLYLIFKAIQMVIIRHKTGFKPDAEFNQKIMSDM